MPKHLVFVSTILLLLSAACAQEKRFTQPNSAMEPTVLEEEKFAADMNAYQNQAPQRGDVVVFHHDDILMLKRVIAIAGDTIEGGSFQIIVNGTTSREGYIQHKGKNPISPSFSFLETFGPVKVTAGRVFVMGDNRDFSDDSRDPKFGTIPISEVQGKAVRIVKSGDPQREGLAIR
jgi:signal peptidase I